jgi:hypothetical protein
MMHTQTLFSSLDDVVMLLFWTTDSKNRVTLYMARSKRHPCKSSDATTGVGVVNDMIPIHGIYAVLCSLDQIHTYIPTQYSTTRLLYVVGKPNHGSSPTQPCGSLKGVFITVADEAANRKKGGNVFLFLGGKEFIHTNHAPPYTCTVDLPTPVYRMIRQLLY